MALLGMSAILILQVFSGEKQQAAEGPLDCRGWRITTAQVT